MWLLEWRNISMGVYLAQKNKKYQALATKSILSVASIHCWFWSFSGVCWQQCRKKYAHPKNKSSTGAGPSRIYHGKKVESTRITRRFGVNSFLHWAKVKKRCQTQHLHQIQMTERLYFFLSLFEIQDILDYNCSKQLKGKDNKLHVHITPNLPFSWGQ